jgi:hypothetical protein
MVKYTIEKSKTKNSWIIWKEIKSDHGFGIFPIYRGKTRKECYKRLKEIKDNKYQIDIKRDVIDNELYFNREMN